MRIGVNLLFMTPGEAGGSETYLVHLLESMLPSPHEFHVFAVRGYRRAYPEISDRCHVTEVPWASGAQGLRIAAEHSWLAVESARRRLDVMHHGGGTSPFFRNVPSALTIHDIQYVHYPENFLKLKRAWLRANVPRAVQKCDEISVPSRFVKDDLMKEFRIAHDKITVVPFGSGNLLGTDHASEEEVRNRYRLTRPFFYCPARTYPHKNHRFLVEAFAPHAEVADLLLTGAPWFRDGEVAAAARHLGLSGKVRLLGNVPPRERAALYRSATALVFPSRFEGFGVPTLEAMSLGCPVISSNSGSLPEVVDEAGILLDPDDLEGWREAMERMLTRPSLRGKLTKRGLARAAEFTWDRSGRLQLAIYERVAGRR